MNISLSPHLEKLVQDRVKSGRYTSASEVIREALRLLHDRAMDQGLAQLHADVESGLRQIDEGKTAAFDEEAVDRIKRRGRGKLLSE